MDLFPIEESKEEASYFRKVFVGMIDILFILFLTGLFFIYQKPYALYQLLSAINGTLLVVICFVIYRMLSFFVFGRTIGMKIFNVCLLNGELQPLSFIEKLLASVFILYKGVDYYND